VSVRQLRGFSKNVESVKPLRFGGRKRPPYCGPNPTVKGADIAKVIAEAKKRRLTAKRSAKSNVGKNEVGASPFQGRQGGTSRPKEAWRLLT